MYSFIRKHIFFTTEEATSMASCCCDISVLSQSCSFDESIHDETTNKNCQVFISSINEHGYKSLRVSDFSDEESTTNFLQDLDSLITMDTASDHLKHILQEI